MTNSSHDDDGGGDYYLDITDLVRHVASQCLSLSHPFTPLQSSRVLPTDQNKCKSPDNNTTADDLRRAGDDDTRCCEELVMDGTLLGKNLRIRDTDTSNDDATNYNHNEKQPWMEPSKIVPQLNLLDAMSALELGDERMDCCEIPIPFAPTESTGTSAPSSSICEENGITLTHAQSSPRITFPPRIAPKSLSDGVPLICALMAVNSSDNNYQPTCRTSSDSAYLSANNNNTNTVLLVPTPPCPSLLPHWNTLRLTSTSLLPLLLLQLTALEAYIGTNNGGSNAAETLYCMLWLHDGVLLDMAEQLGVSDMNATIQKYENEDEQKQGQHLFDCTQPSDDELFVARWILFASSLGIVRIAEAVRLVVVSADFYEEEDFGVALHGEKSMVDDQVGTTGGGAPETRSGSTMRFCPALQSATSQYCEIIWETALSHIRSYRSSWTVANSGEVNCTIEALETIIRLQQSFYQAVHVLSNLSGNTVRDFTNIAVQRSKEVVSLLAKLRDNDDIIELSKTGLVGLNGQLQTCCHQSELDQLLLSASFDAFVNRRYLGNAPVRKACFHSIFDVISSLSHLATELEWGVCDIILHGNSLGRITTMLENNSLRGCGGAVPFQAHDKESLTKNGLETESPVGMNILSRSLIVLNLFFDDKLFGQHDFAYLVAQHMRQCAVPDLLLVSTDLLSIMAKPMYETLKALCLNRHRERGYTETILLPTFELLQYESAVIDEQFKIGHGLDMETTPSYATNYVIMNTLRLMERYLGLGIELGLYPNWWDLHTTLWYRDFLLSALINVKGVIEDEMGHKMEMELQLIADQKGNGTHAELHTLKQKKKKTKSKNGRQSKNQSSDVGGKCKTDDFEERLEYASLLLRRNLSRGLLHYISALCQAKLLPNPPVSITTFTSHRKRFDKRFEAFRSLPHPPYLTYDDYVSGSDFSTCVSDDLLASATNCFRSAKALVDWLLDAIVVTCGDEPANESEEKRQGDDLFIPMKRPEILQIAKVCVHNLLSIHKLSSIGCGSQLTEETWLEFNTHKQYCTLHAK